MRKFITIFFFSSVLFLSTQSIADTKLDCSKYSTKTLKGLTDKIRCKKGLDPRKENNISFFDSINIFKPKNNNTQTINKNCSDYSTKTFASLVGKIKCKKNNDRK
jgi:hypothetical protein